MADKIERRFAAAFKRLCRVQPSDRVLVAVSGGLDSVALLHLLRFSFGPSIDLHVAHFDHAMRDDSHRDADWVRGLARSWELPFHSERSGQRLRAEADARDARYAFLARTADEIDARAVVLGHHADDQVETILFRLLRGTGVDGLSGIPAKRGRYIRPLLHSSRAEIERYALRHRLEWREDPTNLTRVYARNRIRQDLLPKLERGWPSARRSLLVLAQAAARHKSGWQSALAEIEKSLVAHEDTASIALARTAFLEYHPEVRIRLLRRWLARLLATPGRAGTAAVSAFIISAASGSSMQIRGVRIERDFDTIRLVKTSAVASRMGDEPLTIDSHGSGEGITVIGGQSYKVHWCAGDPRSATCERLPGDSTFSAANVQFPLTIRSWQPGDRILLSYGTKKLKKLFAEKRLERADRHRVPVLVDAGNQVLWIAGIAQAWSAPNGDQAPSLSIRLSPLS